MEKDAPLLLEDVPGADTQSHRVMSVAGADDMTTRGLSILNQETTVMTALQHWGGLELSVAFVPLLKRILFMLVFHTRLRTSGEQGLASLLVGSCISSQCLAQ